VKAIKINQHNSIPDNYTGIEEWENGDKFWYKEGNLHRIDGPAIELSDGSKHWYKKNKLHRINGPAIELSDGAKFWYKEGEYHRLNGPAIEYPDGRKFWYKEGNLHRLDGPAIELSDGTKFWYKEGKRHRIAGPAREYSDGTKEWWIEDNFYAPKELLKLINSSFFLGKEKGQYNLEWIKFLTENGIEEFPIIPGMKSDFKFKKNFKKLSL
jgi:hypothetical protein